MKKLIYIFLLLPLLSACNIKEDDRYIDTGEIHAARNVLLEEFTGQFCPNCPAGHQIIESLEHQYGDALIVVSVHAGNFGVPAPVGLMEPEGNDYAQRWNVEAYPSGVVDMKGRAMDREDWAEAVRTEIGKETPLELSLTAQLSENGEEIEVFTTLVSETSLKGSLQLWVVENDIVAFQQDGNNIIPAYVHNNVFRACVNGLWGEEVPLTANEVEYKSNTVAVSSTWNLEHTYIVGFYYDSTGVYQVERCELGD